MALTEDYKDTIIKRAKLDPDFQKELILEAISLINDKESDIAVNVLVNVLENVLESMKSQNTGYAQQVGRMNRA